MQWHGWTPTDLIFPFFLFVVGVTTHLAIETRLEQRAAGLAREFVERFEAGRFDEAIESSRKMQFVQRIQQQLDELQFELEDF